VRTRDVNPKATPANRAAAVHALRAVGKSHKEIARTLGMRLADVMRYAQSVAESQSSARMHGTVKVYTREERERLQRLMERKAVGA
jgi:uncharacterized protein Smg (DUF494 family)